MYRDWIRINVSIKLLNQINVSKNSELMLALSPHFCTLWSTIYVTLVLCLTA